MFPLGSSKLPLCVSVAGVCEEADVGREQGKANGQTGTGHELQVLAMAEHASHLLMNLWLVVD